ncbi:MAG: hypothetical protein V4592_25340 [Bacteroidota bacterium]
MNKAELGYILKHRKWRQYWRQPSHRGGRYLFLFAAPMFLYILFLIEKGILVNHTWEDKDDPICTAIGAGLAAVFLIFFFIKNIVSQSRFTVIDTARIYDTREILSITQQLNWKGSTSKDNNTIEVLTQSVTHILQQRVTIIILNDHQLLFNSYSLSELVLFDRNSSNLKKFLGRLNEPDDVKKS